MSHKKHRLLLGAHVSIAGGFQTALEHGESIDCTTIQIFTKSNQQWAAKPISQEDRDAFLERKKVSSIDPVVVHASYLINIGSPDPETIKKSIKGLIEELQRCEFLEIPYLVLHPGSHLQTSIEDCLERIAKNLDVVFDAVPGKCIIALETMAGQGSTVGNTFAQLATIIKKSHHKNRLGICLDTCHVFAAGYDISTKKGYEAMWQEFDQEIGLEKLKVIHCNDSKKECGSHVDRHDNIGDGLIGLEGFKLIFNDPRLYDIPKILETPKATLSDDQKNMEKLIALMSQETRKKLNME